MKCCNRHCNDKAIGRVNGVMYRRCSYHESQYKSNSGRRKVWDSVDIGRGKCYRKNCDKFTGKNETGLCDMHEHYRIEANKKQYHKRPEYIERARKKNKSSRLTAQRIVVPRPKKTVPALPNFIGATGNKFIELFNRRMDEIYQ